MKDLLFLVIAILKAQSFLSNDITVDIHEIKKFSITNQSYFNFMIFDNISQDIFIGGVDYIYLVNGISLQLKAKSENISNTSLNDFSNTYQNTVNNCQILYQNKEACQNHVRIIKKLNNGQIYVCATGAYNPLEYYLNSSLMVVSVGSKGDTKCPYDPYSQNLFISYEDFMYTALHVSPSMGYQIYRVQFGSASSAILKTDIVLSDVNYIATFDIDKYIYFFFREILINDPVLGIIQASKVARVCKNDNGGQVYKYQFMTYSKARIACTINKPGKNSIVFNELVDIQYDTSRSLFYGLFQLTSGSNFGSALCTFNYSSIEKVFYESDYMFFEPKNFSWNTVPKINVPNPRLTTCNYTKNTLDTNEELFAYSYYNMVDIVQQNNSVPPFYINNLSLQKFTHFTVNSTHSIFYFMSDDKRSIVRRYLLNVYDANPLSLPNFNIITNTDLSYLKDINIHEYNNETYLYILFSNTFVQFPIKICSNYKYCTDCASDILCNWQANACIFNENFEQAKYITNPLQFCAQICFDQTKKIMAIPGMSVTLPLISKCKVSSPVKWLLNNSDIIGNKFLLSDNSSMIILSYDSKDVGIYKCLSENVTLVEYEVETSACKFEEDIRSVMINEFKNWCSAIGSLKNQRYDFN